MYTITAAAAAAAAAATSARDGGLQRHGRRQDVASDLWQGHESNNYLIH